MYLQSALVLRGKCSSEMFVELPFSGGFFSLCLFLVESMIHLISLA